MLYDLDVALHQHYLDILSNINQDFLNQRVAISLVDDERSDFLVMEEYRKGYIEPDEEQVSRVKYPFSILYRGNIKSPDWKKYSSVRHTTKNVIVSKDENTGNARVVKTGIVELEYILKVYDDNFRRLSDLTEFWILNAGGLFTKLTFSIPEADGSSIDASIHYDEPETLSLVKDESRELGLRFVQRFPIKLRTVLVGQATDQAIILENVIVTEYY